MCRPRVCQRVAALDEIGHGVEPEAVHSHLRQPEAGDVARLLAHGGSFVVQVGHPAPEDGVVVLVAQRGLVPHVLAPRPLRRRLARREPEPAAMGRRRIAERLLEVRVLARRMVQHEVHQHADAALVRLGHQPLEIGVGTVVRLDLVVVGHVVAVIAGRLGHRHQPEAARAQIRAGARIPVVDVVERLGESVEVADPVTVAVAEGADEDLVAGRSLRPSSGGGAGDRLGGKRRGEKDGGNDTRGVMPERTRANGWHGGDREWGASILARGEHERIAVQPDDRPGRGG